MIVRKTQRGWVIVTQPDHAWASGELVDAVNSCYVDQRFTGELHSVIARHDDGWVDWEVNPRRDTKGIPVNFDQIDEAVHDDIWRRGIRVADRDIGPYAAAVLVRHAQALSEDTDFSRALSMKYTEYAREAMPSDDPVVREWHVERGFYLLQFCDVLTLMPSAGWEGPKTMVLLNEEAQPVEVTATRTGDWTIKLDTWPFNRDRVEVIIPLTHVEGEDWDAALEVVKSGKRYNQRLEIVH